MKRPKILAIDDQNDNLLVLKALTEEAFADVVFLSAQNGRDGIEVCLAEKPDVVLLDVIMPGMDGYEVCQWLKSNPETQIIPVVFVTAIGYTKQNRLKAIECGADAFLTKPIDEAELVVQLKAMMRLKVAEDRRMDENERLKQLVVERAKSLETSEMRYRQLFSEMQLGFALHELVADENGIYNNYKWLDVNPAYELLTGLKRDQLIGKNVLDVLPNTESYWIENYADVAQTGKSKTFENYSAALDKYFNVVAFCPQPNQFVVLVDDVTERRQNEEKLKTSEAQFREFFEKAADAIFIADIETGVITDVNIAATRLLKRKAHELIGLHQSQLHPPGNIKHSVDSFDEHKKAAKSDEINKPIENEVVDADGKIIPVEILASKVNLKGKPYLLGTFRDISDRKKNEEKIRAITNQLYESNRVAKLGSWEWNLETNEVWWSDETYRIFGVSPENYKPSFEENGKFIHPDDFNQYKLLFERSIKTGQQLNYDLKLITGDGRTIYSNAIGNVEYNDAGKPVKFIGSIQDISDRKLAEKEKSELYEFQQSLLKTIPYGMDIVDESGNVLFQNDLLENVFGKEAIGRKCWHLYRDNKSQCLECPLFKGIDIGKTEIYTTSGILGGRTFEISHTGMIYKGKKAMLEIFRDITEQVEASDRINMLANALENINECVVITDLDDRITYVNKSLTDTYQYLPEELIGEHVRILRPESFSIGHARDVLEKTGEDSWKGQLVNRKKDGTMFPISLSTTMIYDSDHQPQALIGIAVDITEEIWKHDELIQTKIQAELNENRYKQFISQVSDGVYRFEAVDPVDILLPVEKQIDLFYDQMVIAECNDAFVKMFGAKNQRELIGKKQIELHGGKESELNRDALRRFIKNGYRIEGAVTEEFNSFGKRVYFRNNSVGIIENDHLVRIWGTQVDITENIRAEKVQKALYAISMSALSATNMGELIKVIRHELSEIVDTYNFLLALYDEKTDTLTADQYIGDQILHVNWPASKSATGYVIRHKCSLLVNYAEAQKMVETGEVDNVGDPAKIWLGVPLIADNTSIGAIVIQHYTNENAFSEEDKVLLELISSHVTNAIIRNQSQQKLRLLGRAIDQSPVTVVITDKSGNIQYANPMFSRTTGYAISEVLGQNPRILKSGNQEDDFYRDLWNTISSGKDWFGELQNRRKNGELYWESCVISPVYSNDGEIQSFIAVKEDVTDKKRMMDEIIEAKEKAEEADRLKSAFLANMSHEIRTPLNSIIGFSDLIADPFYDNAQYSEFAKIISENGNNLLNIISDIMDFSKIESGQVSLSKKKFSLNNLIRRVSNEFIIKLSNDQLSFKVELPTDEYHLESDEYRIRQILVNFITNAVKFTESGEIKISFTPEHDHVKIFVKDTGIGIPREYHQLIFERFRQVDERKSRKYGGNGLGLAISKSLVELLGGNIGVESEPGKGSTFYFTLQIN